MGQRMLAGYRRATRPDDEARSRLLARLETPAARAPWTRIVVGSSIALAIAATVMLGLGVGYRAVLGQAETETEPGSAASHEADAPRSRGTVVGESNGTATARGHSVETPASEPRPEALVHERAPDPQRAPEARSSDDAGAPTAATATRTAKAEGHTTTPAVGPHAEPARDAATGSDDPLAEEAKLISQAQRALRNAEVDEALEHVRRHESRFPHGQLTPERRALKGAALCRQGHREEGIAAARLDALAPDSPLRERIDIECRQAL